MTLLCCLVRRGCWLAAAGLLGVVSGGIAAPSSPWALRAWQTEQGLPENNVTGVAQTPDGYLWVATHGGLARFDGVRFQLRPLPISSGQTNSLIRTMTLGRGNTLWIGLEAERGLVVGLSEKGNKVFTSADGLSAFKPLVITQTGDGAVWVGYVDGSVCRIASGVVKRFAGPEGLSGTGGCWVTAVPGAELWFAKAGRVGVFRGDHFESLYSLPERTIRLGAARDGGVWICAGRRLMKSIQAKAPELLGELPTERTGVDAAVLFEDRTGGLWIGTTAGGLFHWNGTNIVAAETSHGDITSITEDREGNIWVGTEGGGLDRLRNRVLELHGSAAGLPFETARSVCEDDAGTIWATGANGALVRLVSDNWQTLTESNGWSGARATCVASDHSGGVWIGTYRGGLVRWREGGTTTLGRGEGLGGDNVRALLVDSQTNLWIGLEATNCLQRLRDGHFTTFTQPAGSRTLRTIAEDAAGRLWLGTSDGYLFRVENDVLVDESARVLQPAKPIRALQADADGSLWIAYAGAGVGRLRDGQFTRFGTEQGLLDNYISSLEADDTGALWFASGHGIFQVRRRELDSVGMRGDGRVMAVDFGRNEALLNLQGSYGYWPTSVRARDGRIWFATRSGLVVADARRLQPNRIPPVVHIEKLLVDGRPKELEPDFTQQIPPGHRKVEIEFTAFSFAAPESILFRHKLEGWDEDWSEPSSSRSVGFSRLTAGDYELRVIARNSAGAWNRQGDVLRFNVEPSLWQRWWFLSGVVVMVIGSLGWTIRRHERRKVRREVAELQRQHAIERERARIARDIHDELGTNLTQIGLLSDLGASHASDVVEIQSLLSKIGERARATVSALDEIVWAANPRNDNLARLADYLCHLADDGFEGSAIRCRKEVPAQFPALPVGAEARHNLALAAKEAFANALRHSQASTVRLRLTWQAPELCVAIEDDGIGFDVAAARERGNGLGNQAARLADIGGTAVIASTPGRGTKVLFRARLAAGLD